MPVNLVYEKAAAKMLARMQPKMAAAFEKSLAAIAENPFAHHANVSALAGVADGYRLRRGNWRAVYRVDRAADRMTVIWIGPRGGAYR